LSRKSKVRAPKKIIITQQYVPLLSLTHQISSCFTLKGHPVSLPYLYWA
jgi:hypothetical protein